MSRVHPIVPLQPMSGPPEVDQPRPERRLIGAPERRTWNRYTDPSESVFAGVWESDPGAWRIEVPAGQEEMCTLVHGRVRLVDDEGSEHTFGPGDSFVIPGGFHGTWETLEPLRKVYMVAVRPG
jgi:uncharacterized cupin superfamily protein